MTLHPASFTATMHTCVDHAYNVMLILSLYTYFLHIFIYVIHAVQEATSYQIAVRLVVWVQ